LQKLAGPTHAEFIAVCDALPELDVPFCATPP
jgi:hypothetical protein